MQWAWSLINQLYLPPRQLIWGNLCSQERMATRSRRQYDLVVFGVTGYTGKFVAEEVYRIQTSAGGHSLQWAVAGRSEEKVDAAMTG